MPSPQVAVVPYNNPSNANIMDAIRGRSTNDYQARVPAATKAGVQAAVESMWDYVPARNQFVDALVNMIGSTIVRNNVWSNPLSPFKRGMLNFGESIEEVSVGLLNAYHYDPNSDYDEATIFGREPNEVQSRFHKMNRTDFYKLTVNRTNLRRAFLNEGGLSAFVNALMAQISTSDQWDEFLLMSNLFSTYYNEGGFFQINTPDILNAPQSSLGDNSKALIRSIREYSQTMTFMSRKYNAAHMPVVARPEDLMLILTPRGNATLDVDALAAAFNIDKMSVPGRTVVLPQEYVNIPNFQALLTTKDFFVCADNYMEMQQSNNPAALFTNYFWHHGETISASPFVPSLLFTTDPSTPIIINSTPVVGVSTITLEDITGTTVTTATRGTVTFVFATATTNPANGVNNGVTYFISGEQSSRTHLSQTGMLIVGQDEAAQTIKIVARATDDPEFYSELVVTLTGAYIEGSIGQFIDESGGTAIANKTLPKIKPTSLTAPAVGTVMTVDPGKWDTPDLTFAYAWYRNGTAISGATTDSYTVATADENDTLTVVVTASKTGLTSATATSAGVLVPNS